MADFERTEVQTLVSRLNEQPHHLIAVFGPRQSGKTTIVQQALRTTHRKGLRYQLDVVDPTEPDPQAAVSARLARKPDMEWLVNIWNDARMKADSHPNGFVLALDEIQEIPNWSSIVKGLWDTDRAENRQLHVIILGSAPMPMQSGLRESLFGRFELLPVAHWSFDEMADAFGFTLDEFLFFGGYPRTAEFIRDEERWHQYVSGSLIGPTIEKDILAMTRVDKPALLRQLFELGSHFSGQILPYNRMLGQLLDAGNTTTLARYLDLLSMSKLLTGFQKYAPSKRRIRESSPKLNVCNTALMTAISDYTFEQARADRTFWGHLVESAVGAHIVNTAPGNVKAYYWRDKVGQAELEVDFVLQQGPLTIGIEVKSGRLKGQLHGLEEFKRKFKPHRTILVGDDDIHLGEFLATPVRQWFNS